MKTSGSLLAILAIAGLAACASPMGNKLSYAQVQSLNPGVSASWVLSEFPFGKAQRAPDGKVQAISYNVKDPQGKSQSLRLDFDQNEVLRRKLYSGPVVKPGGSHSKPANQ